MLRDHYFWLFVAPGDGTSRDLTDALSKITLRAGLAALVSFAVAVIVGPPLIRWLSARFREPNASPSPQIRALHEHKSATPTLGGLLIVGALLVAILLFGNWHSPYVWLTTATVVALAALGAVDDAQLRSKSNGLSARTKLAAQLVISAAAAVALNWIQRDQGVAGQIVLPVTHTRIALTWLIIPWTMLVLVASTNSVNLTDGLDGLASGCLLIAMCALAALCYAAGHREIASYLGVAYLPQSGELTVLAAAAIGGLLGFLWFNCHPAQVFMGDTGSLAMGGLLGLLAVSVRQELLLVVLGGIFVAEALSVIVQIASCRYLGRRALRCAPLHHHFQLSGWSEEKIVTRFWIAAIMCAVAGLALVKGGTTDTVDRRSPTSLVTLSDPVTPTHLRTLADRD